jgi:hypothetical protein
MAIASNLGYPRIGLKRELKNALEKFWGGKSSEEELLITAQEIRQSNWLLQAKLGLHHIPSNDYNFHARRYTRTTHETIRRQQSGYLLRYGTWITKSRY